MRNAILLTGATMLLATAALAGPPTKKDAKKAAPTKIECAVMKGHEVDIKKATEGKMFADYKGNRYFFCCGGCPAAFKKDPAKFASAPHIATPKAGKSKKA